jgi:hypothetical protein
VSSAISLRQRFGPRSRPEPRVVRDHGKRPVLRPAHVDALDHHHEHLGVAGDAFDGAAHGSVIAHPECAEHRRGVEAPIGSGGEGRS